MIDEDGSVVLSQIISFVVANELDVGELHERKVFLMTDSSFVDDVELEPESGGNLLVSPGRRDRVGVGIILHHNGVALPSMGLEKRSELAGPCRRPPLFTGTAFSGRS